MSHSMDLISSPSFKAVDWNGSNLVLIDQTLLPGEERYHAYSDAASIVDAIQRLVVRGAPAIGVAGAFGVVVAMDEAKRRALPASERDRLIDSIRDARPTAVNLAWAVDRVREFVSQGREAVLGEALKLDEEERLSAQKMSILGADWICSRLGKKPLNLLTHCNTGSLATTGTGTALGVVKELHARGCVREVFADETRPLLQGSRLKAWELAKSGIPYRILADSAAAMAILGGKIDAALIGADRIARNGDTANKIGSLGVALACREAGIPFLVVAPESTVDRGIPDGGEIHIEMRSDEELAFFRGIPVAPPGTRAFNPAFDVTPARFISAVITDIKAYEVSNGEGL
jgi:methylthioribose-1-phosphate isomerase